MVSSRHAGSIYPASRQELLRHVFVAAGAHVTGAVFGQRIAVECDSRIDGPVFATMSLAFDVSGEGSIRLGSGAGGRRSVIVEGDPLAPSSPKVLILGDVFGPRIRLSNAVVAGNVTGGEVYLDRCLVIGGVLSSGILDCGRSVAGWFWAKEAHLRNLGLIVPFGCATHDIEVHNPVKCLGFRELSCLGGEKLAADLAGVSTEAVELNQDDVERVEYIDPKTNESQTFKILSAQTRAWDLTDVSETARRNVERILGLLLPAATDASRDDPVYRTVANAFERLISHDQTVL